MSTSRISAREYEPLVVDAATAADIRDAVVRVERNLRPRIPLLSETSEGLVIGNLVGGIRLRSGNTLEVLPKIHAESEWTSAVLDLLQPDSRIELQGIRDASFSPNRPRLQEAIAIEFANRLEQALNREGPIQILQDQRDTRRSPMGRLDVVEWLRRVPLNPTIFPVSYSAFSTRNQFTEAIAYTARILALGAQHGRVSSKLSRLADLVLPGEATPSHVPPAVMYQPLPQQWRQYERVWSLVLAVLRNQTLLNSLGRLHGLEVAVEPWPLLETLLSRVIGATAQLLSTSTIRFDSVPKRRFPLLLQIAAGQPATRTKQQVEPDGVLTRNGSPFATYEAKYSPFLGSPKEEHVYQALTAAAALGAKVSILVYPEQFEPISYRVRGFSGGPDVLIAVGLGLYSYRKHRNDEGALASQLAEPMGQCAGVTPVPKGDHHLG